VQKVKAPVMLNSTDSVGKEIKRTLVKQSSNYVYQLYVIKDDSNLPPPATILRSIKAHDVFIEGILAGKNFIVTQKKVHILSTLFAQ
jgi:hypothetical protein